MPAISKSTVLKFFKRREIQEALILHAQQKEIGMRYGEIFGKRPDVLHYPRDVLELVLQSISSSQWAPENVISFHASEEIWSNPISLHSNLTRNELNELRVGWDLVLDVDCKILEYSKITTHLIIQFLKYCGVKDISVKFSGNKGFHVGVPFEAFPKMVGTTLTKDLFPEAPRKIAYYVKENIKETLGKHILESETYNFNAIREKVKLETSSIVRYETDALGTKVAKLNVDKFLEIDTILLASRHLYRMPYSLHEKSGLVSRPLDPDTVMSFTKEQAVPEQIFPPLRPFLDRNVAGESARQLLVQALDFEIKQESKDYEKQKRPPEEITITSPITEEFFPFCMKTMCNGLEDGKKRAVFCLMNYLGKIGWNKDDIEAFLMKWNREKNRVPLREVYIKGQLNHFKPGERLPPNCDNDAYYANMGIACNAEHCRKFKNPVNYTLYKWKRHLREKQEEEEREMRKSRRRKREGAKPNGQEQNEPPHSVSL